MGDSIRISESPESLEGDTPESEVCSSLPVPEFNMSEGAFPDMATPDMDMSDLGAGTSETEFPASFSESTGSRIAGAAGNQAIQRMAQNIPSNESSLSEFHNSPEGEAFFSPDASEMVFDESEAMVITADAPVGEGAFEGSIPEDADVTEMVFDESEAMVITADSPVGEGAFEGSISEDANVTEIIFDDSEAEVITADAPVGEEADVTEMVFDESEADIITADAPGGEDASEESIPEDADVTEMVFDESDVDVITADAPVGEEADVTEIVFDESEADVITADAPAGEDAEEFDFSREPEALHEIWQEASASQGGGASGGRRAGGGGGRAASQEWQQNLIERVNQIPDPDFSAVVDGPAILQQAGVDAVQDIRESGEGVADEGRDQLEEPPDELQQVDVPEENPVPGATRVVEAEAGKRLPEQALPVIEPSPGGNRARLVRIPDSVNGSGGSFRIEFEEPPAPQMSMEDEGVSPADEAAISDDQTCVDDISDIFSDPPQSIPETGASVAPIVLQDTGAPEAPEFSDAEQADIAKVIARLFDNTQEDIDQWLVTARTRAYPNEKLQELDTSFGDDMKGQFRNELEAELRGIAEAAGVGEEALNQAIDNRQAQLEEGRRDADDNLEEAADTAEEDTAATAQEEEVTLESVMDALDDYLDEQFAMIEGTPENAETRILRNRLLRRLRQLVAGYVADYRQVKENRLSDLTSASTAIGQAYRRAADMDRTQFLEAAGDDESAREQALADYEASRTWARRKSREATESISGLERAAERTADGYISDMNDAGLTGAGLIRAWADHEMGAVDTWFRRLIQRVIDAIRQSRTNVDTWGTRRRQENARQISDHLHMIGSLRTSEQARVEFQQRAEAGTLSEEETVVYSSYFVDENTQGNAITAVAAGMKVRLRSQRVPMIRDALIERVRSLPRSEWEFLDSIGASQRSGFSAAVISGDLYEAMHEGLTGLGTDEDRIFRALAGLTPEQAIAVRGAYWDDWSIDLDADLASELSGSDKIRADSLLSGNQAMADAAALDIAMSGAGTDEEAIMSILRNKTEEERQAIIEAYHELTGNNLMEDLDSEMDDNDQDQAEALMVGNTALADAIELESSMSGGWFFGLGTDEDRMEGVYERIRREVADEARSKGWTHEEMEAEVLRRNGEVEREFGNQFSADYEREEEGQSVLQAAFDSELSGAEERLIVALSENDQVAADAARLDEEFSSVFTDDDAIRAGLERSYTRARLHVELDVDADLRILRERRQRGEELTEEEEARLNTPREELIQERLPEVSRAYMSEVEESFDRQEGWDGALRLRIAFNTSGADKRAAYALLENGGHLPGEMSIDFAIQEGDEETVVRVLREAKPDEIAGMRRRYEEIHGQNTFDAYIRENLEGRDLQDANYYLLPPANSPEERVARERERIRWELDETTAPWASAERRMLQRRLDRLERSQEALENADENDPRIGFIRDRFDRRVSDVESGIKTFRQGVDSGLDTLLTAITIYFGIAALVVGIALTILTGGGAAPLLAGICIALEGMVATIVTKQMVLGDAYKREDLITDLTVGLVDAAVSAVTAGLGDKLLKTGRMAALAGRGVWGQVAARAITETVESVAGSAPSSIVGLAMDDAVIQATDTASIMLSGVATDVGMGLVMDHGMSIGMSLGGRVFHGIRARRGSMPDVDTGRIRGLEPDMDAGPGRLTDIPDADMPTTHLPPAPGESMPGIPRNTDIDTPALRNIDDAVDDAMGGPGRRRSEGDMEGNTEIPGSPEERAALWARYQSENPGASRQDFMNDLQEGAISFRDIDADIAQMQRQMRDELTAALSPEQAAMFRDIDIEVISDAEFFSRTGSRKGNAVVIIEGGQPRIVVKESVPLSTLREEGLHLAQLVDPHTRADVLRLDEANLSRWNDMSLDEQLDLYSTKIDLEIDAGERLAAHLRDAIGDMPDGPTRRQLMQHLADVEEALDNLRGRSREVADITPEERAEISAGRGERPDYLDQPARLFSKSSDDFVARLPEGTDTGKARKTLDRIKTQDPEGFAAIRQVAAGIEDPVQLSRFMDALSEVTDGITDVASLQKFTRSVATLSGRAPALDVASSLHVARHMENPADFVASLSDRVSRLKKADAADYMHEISALSELSPQRMAAVRSAVAHSASYGEPMEFMRKLNALAATDTLPDNILGNISTRISGAGTDAPLTRTRATDYLDTVTRILAANPAESSKLHGLISATVDSNNPVTSARSIMEMLDAGVSHTTLKTLNDNITGHHQPGGIARFLEASAVMSEMIPDVNIRRDILTACSLAENGFQFMDHALRLSQARHPAALTRENFARLMSLAADDPKWARDLAFAVRVLESPDISTRQRYFQFDEFNKRLGKIDEGGVHTPERLRVHARENIPDGLPDTIPSVKDNEFGKWFDTISQQDFEEIWTVPVLREDIESRLRHPGGLHEWLCVSRAPKMKEWGVTADMIADMRNLTDDVKFKNPPGKHGDTGSSTAHNEIFELIDTSPDFPTYRKRLQEWADKRLVGGAAALPDGLRP